MNPSNSSQPSSSSVPARAARKTTCKLSLEGTEVRQEFDYERCVLTPALKHKILTYLTGQSAAGQSTAGQGAVGMTTLASRLSAILSQMRAEIRTREAVTFFGKNIVTNGGAKLQDPQTEMSAADFFAIVRKAVQQLSPASAALVKHILPDLTKAMLHEIFKDHILQYRLASASPSSAQNKCTLADRLIACMPADLFESSVSKPKLSGSQLPAAKPPPQKK